MRVLVFGDLAPTGFGTVTTDLGAALLALGHDLRFVSQNELGDLPEPFLSRTFQVDPSILDPARVAVFGADSLSLTTLGVVGLLDGTLWADGWAPEACVVLGDYVGVRMVVMADETTQAAFRAIRSYHYAPIEGVDLPPSWRPMWEVLRPVAMSEFGADQIALVTGVRPPVVYHGVDTKMFRPLSPERVLRLNDKKLRSRADARKFLGASPDARWLFRADRNMPRKRYASLLRAVAPVMAARPDVMLVLHCLTHDQGGDINALRSKYPPSIASRIIPTGLIEQWGAVPREFLVALYNAADVYVSTSAEGFGLTIAEAMACGIPAVGMAYSAVPEVIGPGGLLAPVNHLDDNEWDHAWATVDEQAFGAAVATLLDDADLRVRLGRAAREHVVKSFSWATAARQFAAILEAP